jgi:hypothetical protein
MLGAGAILGELQEVLKINHAPGAGARAWQNRRDDPNLASIFMHKRDTLRATLGIQSDRGEPERWSEKVL